MGTDNGAMPHPSHGEKFTSGSELSSLLCVVCQHPLLEPRQCACGDRLCSKCYKCLRDRGTKTFWCQRCNTELTTDECFRDRAVDVELNRAAFPCPHPNCPWTGSAINCRDHISCCKYAPASCPSSGCNFTGLRSDLDSHLAECPVRPTQCQRCQDTMPMKMLEDHLAMSCPGMLTKCTLDCGHWIVRRELPTHLEMDCPKRKRPCRYRHFGCMFEGDLDALVSHENEVTVEHLKFVSGFIADKIGWEASECVSAITTSEVQKWKHATRLAEEVRFKLIPLREGIAKLESSLAELQNGFTELALMVQTLQATSYNGEFIWKIPEVARRTNEAQMGKTISLYSAPFYTNRFGYKMCLRLYLNGDGSGKGTHLSFFLTIMRGEYDALLSWPFQQMVTLMLLDQDKRKNIVQAFRPEPSSSSFWKPKTEMNIASGCPKFAPLSVLGNPSYVRNDTLYLKVIVDRAGLIDP